MMMCWGGEGSGVTGRRRTYCKKNKQNLRYPWLLNKYTAFINKDGCSSLSDWILRQGEENLTKKANASTFAAVRLIYSWTIQGRLLIMVVINPSASDSIVLAYTTQSFAPDPLGGAHLIHQILGQSHKNKIQGEFDGAVFRILREVVIRAQDPVLKLKDSLELEGKKLVLRKLALREELGSFGKSSSANYHFATETTRTNVTIGNHQKECHCIGPIIHPEHILRPSRRN
ncbi:hypothetical protein B0H14DRAFT_2633931 [Mycena olivaceomarginata]|nr:hypothetical protein B0H14DRAFT_2633931 [Mycena olivaceomarginata]